MMTQVQAESLENQMFTPDKLVTKAEAARLLSVSIRTVDRLCARQLLSKLYVGGAARIRLSDVLKIVQNGI